MPCAGFVGLAEVVEAQLELLVGLVDAEGRLVDLQGDFLLGVVKLQRGNLRFGLGGTHFVFSLAPVPNRNFQRKPNGPCSAEFLSKPLNTLGFVVR